ncbi:MAG: hypothetical protein ABSG76_02520 [Xanthobacteraceae bacterium]|jgi:hypothetical protein
MRYFYVEPEVAGNFGEHIVLDTSTHPPIVHKLHYKFDGWLGDAILETFPCFIVTVDLSDAIEQTKLTGVRFASVEISTSELFQGFYPGRQLPSFRWMQVHGRAGAHDFGVSPQFILIVSARALDLLRRFGLEHAEVRDYEA